MIDDPKEALGYDMADCWASCMIPFDWGLQYDPRGFLFISGNGFRRLRRSNGRGPDPRYLYPPTYTTVEDEVSCVRRFLHRNFQSETFR